MRWEEEIDVIQIDEIWYITERTTGKRVRVEDKYTDVMEAISQNLKGEELIRFLGKRLGAFEVEIDCMLAEFLLKYKDCINTQNRKEYRIEL